MEVETTEAIERLNERIDLLEHCGARCCRRLAGVRDELREEIQEVLEMAHGGLHLRAWSHVSRCAFEGRREQAREELDYITSICDIELCYSSDLQRVQRNLNDLPHGGRDIPVPAEAVVARLTASRQSAH